MAAKHKRGFWAGLSAVISAVIVISLGGYIAMAMNQGIEKLPIREYFPKTQTNAIWDWTNLTNHTTQDLKETADFLYTHQINTVFVDVGTLQDNNPQTRQEVIQGLERYVGTMHGRGIRVFAGGGDTDWSKPSQQHIPLAIQQFVFDYNRNHQTARLDGIEFDVESYNQDGFPDASFTEKELVLNEYLDMVDRLASAHSQYISNSSDPNLELGFAIPYWYDNENQNIKSVSWHDKTGPVLFHLLDRLNSLPHTNVDVMAYRNAASGNDGMVYHARTEVEYANSKAPNVQVLIGLEVNDVEPAKITFYGRSYTEVSSEVKLLSTGFGNQKSYHGIAINDLPGYKALEQNSKVN